MTPLRRRMTEDMQVRNLSFPSGNLPPDDDWALALAREAVIRPLADRYRSIGSD
jgi:hypothetical protein